MAPPKNKPLTNKRQVKNQTNTSQRKKKVNEITEDTPLIWPRLSTKTNLQLEELLKSQIYIIEDFFTAKECKQLIQFSEETLHFQPAVKGLIPKKGEAFRDNDRFSIKDASFAQCIWENGIKELCENWSAGTKKAVGLNDNIRLYKYNPGQKFDQHYDDSVKDSQGRTSEFTLLIYLNGVDDTDFPLRGGETVFYSMKPKDPPLSYKPIRGSALLHRHGAKCLLHEGKEVLSGVKYVLRSDLMYN
ncbi:hypothetical protein K7432_012697 [Basidiobolus ranarum]|uniref:Fe2OG dioxygenase domain-containing protein n=1 Tax=Basidiobolus ranarum TaxID=34480 RepID=A0ABR2VS21_9FUNG